MRKKDENLKESLLDCAREIAAAEGTDAINIRRIARQAGIATGTVYNYFSNKDDILLALTEEYWRKTLTEMQDAVRAESFVGQLEGIYAFLRVRISDSAGVLMGSLRNVEAAGRERMQHMHKVLREALLRSMEQDSAICEGIWNKQFTKEQYADFIIMNMMVLLRTDVREISFFLEIVRRTLY